MKAADGRRAALQGAAPPAPEDVQRPATAAASSLVSPDRRLLSSRLTNDLGRPC